jgi:hypothetical protein
MGVNPPSAAHRATGHGQAASGSPGTSVTGSSTTGSPTTVQSRNAGASICSGLPAANPDPGTP